MTQTSYRTVEAYHFDPGEGHSNHSDLPVLLYGGVLGTEDDLEAALKRVFSENGWDDFHRRRVSNKNQFHLRSHEVLGVIEGSALLLLGGAAGKKIELCKNDLLLLPAGTAHRLIMGSSNFRAVSAVPEGQEEDKLLNEGDFPAKYCLQVVQATPRPTTDPYFGHKGPLFDFWYDQPPLFSGRPEMSGGLPTEQS
ncbi:MAG TPA: hypothetical protein VJ952_02405 [Opitutales bacterium]|nr:hypothetical protein [Opitutales bacterium]